ncbi:tyrosine-type recombinase/integrase [Lactococcus allomyrinae]|uniref:Site-specific integrase n=1 Tax=Lactococcus allomyrinae TaxID=2419773 RepID=A0A387BCR8_9LACT|nr:site-specific integrase [Lactococcus allomyrinae]AYG01675.1 site-specific integrase [Lactococcus allomyrinae]
MWIEQKSTIDKKNKDKIIIKYLFREKFVDNLTEKERTVSITFDKNTRETRTKAQKILLSKISKLQQDDTRALTPITFGELVTEWLDFYNKQVRSSTAYTVKGNVKLILEMVDKDTVATKITTQFLRKKFEKVMLGDRDISINYARSIRTRLKSIFEYGIDHHYLKENPIDRLKMPKKKKEIQAITEFFLEENELSDLMEYLENHNQRYFLFCQWLYLNGLRFGEGAAMLKSDVIINDDRSYCKVTGTLDYAGKKKETQAKSNQTKTAAGMREVELNSQAIKVFQEACKLSPNSNFIFTTSNNTPFDIAALNTYFRTHKERMGIDKNKRISTHIFRHTHVSKLAELDIPLHIIQRRVGHSSESVTREIYLHVTAKAKDKTRKLLELL